MDRVEIEDIVYRYFVLESVLKFDEDETHEFKGHLNFTKDQVPPVARDIKFDRPSRQPISKTLNAMLNGNCGGTIYIGVSDDAKIHGIILNQYKMDHIIQNVEDMFSCYDPPVRADRYSVHFIPVVGKTAPVDEIRSTVLFDPRVNMSAELSQRPHSLRCYRRCWCDKFLSAQTASGSLNPLYIVEITVFPWNPNSDGDAVGQMLARPIYMNEEGRAYYRGSANVREFTLMELQAFASKIVMEYYEQIESRLEKQRAKLIVNIHSKLNADMVNGDR